MDGLIETGAGKMRQAPRIVAISLVGRERLQCLVGVTALDANDRQAQSLKTVIERCRHAPRLKDNTLRCRRFSQLGRDRCRRRGRLSLVDDLAVAVDHADVRLFHRECPSPRSTPWVPLLLRYRADSIALWGAADPLPHVEKLGDEHGARNKRIRVSGCLNRCCVRDSSFESKLLARAPKIFFQHGVMGRLLSM